MHDDKMDKIMKLASKDPEFQRIKTDFIKVEKDFLKFVHSLSDDQQDLIYDFIFQSDHYDRRILEIACDYIQFPEDIHQKPVLAFPSKG